MRGNLEKQRGNLWRGGNRGTPHSLTVTENPWEGGYFGPCHGLTFGDVFFRLMFHHCMQGRGEYTQGICCSLFVFLFWVETLLRPQKLTSHSKMVCEWNRSLFVAECKNLHFVTPKSLSRKILGEAAILKKNKQISTNQCGPNRCECFRPFSSNLGGLFRKPPLPAMTGFRPNDRPKNSAKNGAPQFLSYLHWDQRSTLPWPGL